MIGLQLRARRNRVATKFIYGTSLKNNEVSTAIYRDFLPGALAAGTDTAAPAPMVVGTGLEDLAKGLEMQRQGVSASKIVVSLPG